MPEQLNENELALKEWSELKRIGGFDISEVEPIRDIEYNPKYKKLALTSGQKMQMSALVGQLPSAAVAGALKSKAASSGTLYLVNCPWGIENTLTQMKNGNYANFLRADGGFIGYAPIFPVSDTSAAASLNAMATATAIFSVMSVATNSYFLTEINKELAGIKQGMDKILEFLYGDKRAELISEISYVKFAYENYTSIMAHSEQRAAVLTGLQEARKVAMRDSEFYISDISSTISKDSGLESTIDKVCRIHETLDLALQLSVLSSILEVHYSGNTDKEFLEYVERELSLYLDKCDKFELGAFSKLHQRVESYKNLPLVSVDKDQLMAKINKILDPLQNGDGSELKRTLHEGLYSSSKPSACYISSEGDVYVKTV